MARRSCFRGTADGVKAMKVTLILCALGCTLIRPQLGKANDEHMLPLQFDLLGARTYLTEGDPGD